MSNLSVPTAISNWQLAKLLSGLKIGQPHDIDITDEARVKHTKIGVWDLYEERHRRATNYGGVFDHFLFAEAYGSLPYVWKMMVDTAKLKPVLLAVYIASTLLSSTLPAVSLYYSGQLLKIVQTAVEQRTIDHQLLVRVGTGKICCNIARRIADYGRQTSRKLNRHISAHFSEHTLHAYVRLDVPTFADHDVQNQLARSLPKQIDAAWHALEGLFRIWSLAISLITQASVLATVVMDHRDGLLLASLGFVSLVLSVLSRHMQSVAPNWIAVCKNEDYHRMQGFKKLARNPKSRKELVTGDLQDYIRREYHEANERLGEDAHDIQDLIKARGDRLFSIFDNLSSMTEDLPMVVFALRSIQLPAEIPVSLATVKLIQDTVSTVWWSFTDVWNQAGGLTQQLTSVRILYEAINIPNQVMDGSEPLEQNLFGETEGISIEFNNVTFRYPGTNKDALRNVSFRVGPGQLCVVVGVNGGGKSTILRLVSRLYDIDEGEILIDGNDIRTLKLSDLRRSMAVLFQDYTHFPLSVGENIGMGDPDDAWNEKKIREAADLGGAKEIIEALPEGYKTFLSPPVRDINSPGAFGFRSMASKHQKKKRDLELSGEQLQRLALSRTFMGSLGMGKRLLIYDEPSASLDPQAEYELFQRLRALRGRKTMVFSSHRFGNLTRHADVIIYMNEGSIVEQGTHEELLKRGGEYARIFTMQAEAFR